VSQTADAAEVTRWSGEVIKAQYVVAADGMNSTIRDLAGLGSGATMRCRCPSRSLTSGWRAPAGGRGHLVLLQSRHVGGGAAPDGSFRLVAEVEDAPEQPDVDMRGDCSTPRAPSYDGEVNDVIWDPGFGSTSGWRTSTGPGEYCSPATPHTRTARQVGKA
jgi:2-polyprenyl-6-methoxyphenol hydroxylase-like FAD-dependent oxidoreductase